MQCGAKFEEVPFYGEGRYIIWVIGSLRKVLRLIGPKFCNKKIPPPIFVKDVGSSFRHEGFYRRSIKNFSKTSHALCRPFQKEIEFECVDACLREFGELQEKLEFEPSIISPDWGQPFEVMYDASRVALGMVKESDDVRFFILFTMLAKL